MIQLMVVTEEIFNAQITADINMLLAFALLVKNWIVLINQNHTNILVVIHIKSPVIINAIRSLVHMGK